MNPTQIILLEFDPSLNEIGKDKKCSQGLSVVVQVGDSLWVANDETTSLERFTLAGDRNTSDYVHAKKHKQFFLHDYLHLPVPAEEKAEVDLEGLAYENGYLWLVGSHSLARKKPKLEGILKEDLERLADVESKKKGKGNRCLLARIPVEESEGSYVLAKKTKRNGEQLTAARLKGDKDSNTLMEALAEDEHLKRFLTIPSKDNGFDIEGLVVVNGHVFIGLRGPVLRGWAIILEVLPEEDTEDSSILKLKAIGSDNRLYRKHFLQLNGLGIRDLCVQGDDLLILAGPTMDLDGPVAVFRWSNGAKPKEESFVPNEKLQRLLDIPYGQGVDHAEGMMLLVPPDGGKAHSILVVYDSAATARQFGENAMVADVFRLP